MMFFLRKINLVSICCSLVLIRSGFSANFNVSNNSDAGAGSFRQAITDLNSSGDPTNTITFTPPALSITLGSDLPVIQKSVLISGNSAIVDGASSHRILVFNANPSDTLTVSAMTVQHGLSLGGSGGTYAASGGGGGGGGAGTGGGVYVIQGSVVLDTISLLNNAAVGGAGGNGTNGLGNAGAGGGGAIASVAATSDGGSGYAGVLTSPGEGSSIATGGSGFGGGGAGSIAGEYAKGGGIGGGGGGGGRAAGVGGGGGSGGFGGGGGGSGGGGHGTGGFAGGNGGTAGGIGGGGGGGGGGLGGGFFIHSPNSVTVTNSAVFTGNSVQLGTGGTGQGAGAQPGGNGYALGADIFMRGGSTLIFNLTSPLTISSSIASDGGSGGGVIINGGQLTFSGTNEYVGGTTFNGGTLSVANDGNLGASSGGLTFGGGSLRANGSFSSARNVTLSSAGTIDVATGSQLTMAGLFQGSGGLVVGATGTGTLILSGTSNNYTGTTVVAAGTLVINGQITSATTVNAGAVLSGIGTIMGDVTINGTLAAGNSIGTLTIAGNYTQASGSTFLCEINSIESDQLIVNSGGVTIESNTTFLVQPAVALYGRNQVYRIITAASLTGKYSNLTVSSPLFTARLLYGNDYLDLVFNFQPLASIATQGNAHQVAKALDKIFTSPSSDMASVLKDLFSLNDSQIIYALDQMHPAQLKGQTIVQENNMINVREALTHHLSSVIYNRQCYSSFQIPHVDYEYEEDEPQEVWDDEEEWDQYEEENDEDPSEEITVCETTDDKQFKIWVNGLGDWFTQKSTHYASSPQVGYKNTTGGILLGADYTFEDVFSGGLLLAYTNSEVNWGSHHGHGEIGSSYCGLYLSAVGKWAYGVASVIGACSQYDSSRKIIFPGENATAKGDTSGAQLTSSLDVGLNVDINGFVFSPFDIFDYVAQTENSFRERHAGPLNLKIRKSNAIMLRNELGLNITRCQCFPSSRWIFEGKISWVREVRIHGKHFTSSFIGTEVPFTVTGYMPDTSLISPGAGLTGFLWHNQLSVNIYYNGLFGRKYTDNSIGGGLTYHF